MSKTYKVSYAPAAQADIRAIYSYIAFELQAGQAAIGQVNRIRKAVHDLKVMPERYETVDWEPWLSMNMHKLPIDNYVIFYIIDEDVMTVTIIRIVYSGRDIIELVRNDSTAHQD